MNITEYKEDALSLSSLIEGLESSTNYKIIKVGAEWCPPCVRLKPYFKESKEKNPDIDFYDIDLGDKENPKNRILSSLLGVKGIPYVVLLSTGNNIIARANDTFSFMEEFKEKIIRE